MQPVHAELMLHWQVSRKQFSLVVLPVAHMDTQRQIRTLEMTLIQRWNPSLNLPVVLKMRISKVGPGYSFAVKQLASSYQAPGTRLTRLHSKLRKRLHKLGALSLYSSSKQEPESSWMILTILSERSLASFKICKGCSDQVLFHYGRYMLCTGCPTTWTNLQGQWYRVCCKISWCLKEV